MLLPLADASKQDEHTEPVSRSGNTHIIAQPKFFKVDSDFLSFEIRLANFLLSPRHFSVRQVGSFPRTIDTLLTCLALPWTTKVVLTALMFSINSTYGRPPIIRSSTTPSLKVRLERWKLSSVLPFGQSCPSGHPGRKAPFLWILAMLQIAPNQSPNQGADVSWGRVISGNGFQCEMRNPFGMREPVIDVFIDDEREADIISVPQLEYSLSSPDADNDALNCLEHCLQK